MSSNSEEITASTNTPDDFGVAYIQDPEFNLRPFQDLERLFFFIGTMIIVIAIQHLIFPLTDEVNTYQVVLTGTCEKELSISCPMWKPECAGRPTKLIVCIADI
jgi:hypothetical protein